MSAFQITEIHHVLILSIGVSIRSRIGHYDCNFIWNQQIIVAIALITEQLRY